MSVDNSTNSAESADNSTYAAYGVSSTKKEIHDAVKDNGRGLFPHAFCKVNEIPGMPEYVCMAHSDGAGTKTSLAYIFLKETGDITVLRGVVQDSIVMNIGDILCVCGGAPEVKLWVTSNIDRNTFNLTPETLPELIKGENEFLGKMRGYGIDIVGQCGETADVPDLTPTLIVNNSVFCMMRRKDVIDNDQTRY
jgi:phosphoribosylformylglycinamidine cyclo-ligase